MRFDSVTCILVHGWAMNSAVWDESVRLLPDWMDVILVDLPGHGSMSEVKADTLDDYVHTLISLVHRPVLWVGWSLGGLAVLRLAELYPQRVAAAMLVSTNPCFVSQEGWDCAVDRSVFKQFASDLEKNQEKTIRRFLALQVKGTSDMMPVARQLLHSIENRGMASPQALTAGLKILLETDLRQSLRVIDSPLRWLFGAKDSLVPAELALALKEDYAQQDVIVHPDASHAPFISQSGFFVEQLVSLAQQIRTGQR